jgi:hypothetical protein
MKHKREKELQIVRNLTINVQSNKSLQMKENDTEGVNKCSYLDCVVTNNGVA